MRIFIVAALILASASSFAADRTQKIQALMDALGLVSMFEQQLALGREQAEQQGQQILNQFMTTVKATPDFENRFRGAFDKYLVALQNPHTAEEIVDVWAKYYGAHFTDQELDDLLAFYMSPLGKKDVAASHKALTDFSNHFIAESKGMVEKSTNEFISELQSVAKECRCSKK